MSCASLVESVVHTPSALVPESPARDAPATDASVPDTHALGERIATLAARLHAITYDLLVLLQQFDARQGWNTGFLSCAHWLHWRTGIDLGAAREKVRVARALPALPVVSGCMQRGQLSYAKVRALTRVATPGNEQALVDLALAGTAAHVERFVRAWRRVDGAAAQEAESRHLSRRLSTWVDDDGMVVVRGRLTPEVGAVLQRALEAAADRLFREGQSVPASQAIVEQVTPGQRRADALGLLAETALAAGLDAGTAGDRYQVVVHVEAVTAGSRSADAVAAGGEPSYGGSLELDHGPVYVSAETSRRLACDASVVVMQHGHFPGNGCDRGPDHGRVLDVGRKTRTIPPHIRRALAARDATCQFPGCTARRCDAHHVTHWADGGSTSADNLVRLCRRHHRSVHEGGFRVTRTASGEWVFHGPEGRVIPAAPAMWAPEALADDADFSDVTPGPAWDGTPFNLVWAMDVLYEQRARGAGAAP